MPGAIRNFLYGSANAATRLFPVPSANCFSMKMGMRAFLLVMSLLLSVGCDSRSAKIEQLLDNLDAPVSYDELVKIGQPALVPTITKLKAEKDVEKQQYLLMFLHAIGDESITVDLLPFTRSSSGNVREWAIFVLSKISNESGIDALIDSLDDRAIEAQAKELAVIRLKILTGQDIPYRKEMSYRDRQQAIKLWHQWREES